MKIAVKQIRCLNFNFDNDIFMMWVGAYPEGCFGFQNTALNENFLYFFLKKILRQYQNFAIHTKKIKTTPRIISGYISDCGI